MELFMRQTKLGELSSWKLRLKSGSVKFVSMNLGRPTRSIQGHPTTVFGEISVRSPLEWLKFSGAQEQLKISKMFHGDCSLGSEFRDLCGFFT